MFIQHELPRLFAVVVEITEMNISSRNKVVSISAIDAVKNNLHPNDRFLCRDGRYSYDIAIIQQQ